MCIRDRYNIPPPYNITEIIQEITSTLQGSPPVRASTPIPVVEESVVSAVDTSLYREVEPVRTGSGAAMYNHLPNPLAHIIQQLPVVDGLEADKLLPFFKIVFELKDYPGMLERTVLELIFQMCIRDRRQVLLHD